MYMVKIMKQQLQKINALKEEFLQKLNDRTAQTVGNLVNKVDFIKKRNAGMAGYCCYTPVI